MFAPGTGWERSLANPLYLFWSALATTSKEQAQNCESAQAAALNRNCLHPTVWPKVPKGCIIWGSCGIRES
jgi:hypothetical protein